MGKHSILPPSSAHMWSKCTGWVAMNASLTEDEDSEAARIGTAVHELAESLIKGGVFIEVASNGVLIDEELTERALVMVDDVLGTTTKFLGTPLVEQQLSIPTIHRECFGTPDVAFYSKAIHTLYIWDYKDGFGIVEPFENEQLIIYYSGLLSYFNIVDDERLVVVMRIVQPRGYHRDGPIREWRCRGSELRPYVTRISNAAQSSLNGTGQCKADEHCRYCKALFSCEAALQKGIALFDTVSAPVSLEMTPEAMAFQYELIQKASKMLEYLTVSYEAKIVASITSGRKIPGWTLEQSYGRRTWNKDIDLEELVAIGKACGVTLLKPRELVTPTQAKNKKMDESILAAYSHTPKNGLSLNKIDPRKALKAFNII